MKTVGKSCVTCRDFTLFSKEISTKTLMPVLHYAIYFLHFNSVEGPGPEFTGGRVHFNRGS